MYQLVGTLELTIEFILPFVLWKLDTYIFGEKKKIADRSVIIETFRIQVWPFQLRYYNSSFQETRKKRCRNSLVHDRTQMFRNSKKSVWISDVQKMSIGILAEEVFRTNLVDWATLTSWKSVRELDLESRSSAKSNQHSGIPFTTWLTF